MMINDAWDRLGALCCQYSQIDVDIYVTDDRSSVK